MIKINRFHYGLSKELSEITKITGVTIACDDLNWNQAHKQSAH